MIHPRPTRGVRLPAGVTATYEVRTLDPIWFGRVLARNQRDAAGQALLLPDCPASTLREVLARRITEPS